MDSYLEFPYRPSAKGLLFGLMFFTFCGLFLGHGAMTNERGLLLEGIVRLDRHQATIFYWALSALSGGFVALAILALAEVFLSPEKPVLRVTPEEIIIPPFLFRRETRTIPFRDIKRIQVQKVQRQEFIVLHYGDRQKGNINRKWLPDDAAYQQILQLIAEKTAKNLPR